MRPVRYLNDYQTPQLLCPHCGQLTDAALGVNPQPEVELTWDRECLIICGFCGEVNVLSSIGLYKVTPWELATCSAEFLLEIEQLQHIARAARVELTQSRSKR